LAEKRDALEKEHRRKLQEIDERIREQQQVRKDHVDEQARRKVLEQRGQDLAQEYLLTQQRTAERAPIHSNGGSARAEGRPISQPTVDIPDAPMKINTDSAHTSRPPSKGTSKNEEVSVGKSPAEEDWQYQKDIEGATNEHIDALMQMIGLENIKQKVLNIKTKIETVLRQGASLETERFGAVFLGNPGTGRSHQSPALY
jgi:hypothetical protein